MNRAVIVAAALILLSAVAGYIGSPYYTANQLRMAARNADKQRLEQLVDFPQVREHFKTQLNGEMDRRASASSSDNPLAGIGAKLVSAFSGPLIDRLVTADNIAAAIESGRAAKANRAAARASSGEDEPPPQPHERRLLIKTRYQDLDHFLLTIRDRRDPDTAGVALTMTRNGLFSWRVTQIDLPGLLDKN